jgi:hypothetical protein
MEAMWSNKWKEAVKQMEAVKQVRRYGGRAKI